MSFPAYSQYTHVSDPEWQYRSCGIVALLMIMEALAQKDLATPDTLIQEGLAMGAYKEGIGWYHRGLANLATTYGFTASNHDWSKTPATEAQALLLKELAHGPVIASVTTDKGGHLIVIESIIGDDAITHDPAEHNDIRQVIPLSDVYDHWTQRIISVRN